MSFKATLIKSIAAIICVVAICVTATIGTSKICTAKIDAATAQATPSDGSTDVDMGDGNTDYDDNSGVTDADVPSTDISGEPISDAGTDTTNQGASTDGNKTVTNSNGTTPANQVPKTNQQIIDFYNDAMKQAVKSKIGYSKVRITDNEKIDANAVVKSFKSLIYQFMGIGADNKYEETVTKGKWDENPYILESNLTTADLTSAKCVSSNGIYTITLTLKNGSSSASKAKPVTAANAALDRSGICVGTEDKSRFDHKTASVIYDAIAGTYAGVEISESYSNAKVVMTVNSVNSHITSLKVEWNPAVTIAKLLGMTASASGVSHVTYSNIKY